MISGRGSNLKALRDAESGACYQIVGVVSDQPEALGLKYAVAQGIPVVTHPRAGFSTKRSQKEALYDAVRSFRPEVVALAGFMQIVDADFVSEFYGRLINIHPSLLPEFPGLDTHARVIEERERRASEHNLTPLQHGCSVHFVDAGVDTGPLIAQAGLNVLPEENENELAARVLALEHSLYPWSLSLLCSGDIRLCPPSESIPLATVHYSPRAIDQAKQNRFRLTSVQESR